MSNSAQNPPTTVGLLSPFDPRVDIAALAAANAEVVYRFAATDGERKLCARIRHSIFVEEQGIFSSDDRDEHDDDPSTIHILGIVGSAAGGTVRIYRLGLPGLWIGDRLAVLPELRRLMLGKRLVQLAVQSAGTLGGTEMHAYVQVFNTSFFVRLGWDPVGAPAPHHGVAHQKMSIRLGGSEVIGEKP